MKKYNKSHVYLFSIILLVLTIAAVTVIWSIQRSHAVLLAPDQMPRNMTAAEIEPDVTVIYRDVDHFVEVEKEISAATIQEGLRDMGILITQDYYFTEVINYSSVKQAFGFKVPFSESNFIISYDGTVNAGIDFTEISVTKDDSGKKIEIFIPTASVQNVDIDYDSLTVYSEKSGWGNPIKIEDYNAGLGELEKNAANKAVDKGLLEKADSNAKHIIVNVVSAMVDISEYVVTVNGIEV